jgi:hypothetical protein
MTFFEQLFGFPEEGWQATRERFEVEGDRLRSRVNGLTYRIGRFETPTVGKLRERTAEHLPGHLRVRHQVIGDVLELHALPDNAGALFQVASQFNCLEFLGPEITPEDGITPYVSDPTQGPACALAAAPATVFRNYFAQTPDRQLDGLAHIRAALGPELIKVRNGYTFSDDARLAQVSAAITPESRGALRDRLTIGLQTGVEVTFRTRFVPPEHPNFVSQAFCSAISLGYSPESPEAWEPLATLVLEGAYEAALLAAVADRVEREGTGIVWLTKLGGGAFDNKLAWIVAGMAHGLRRVADRALDVRVAHYLELDQEFVDALAAAGVSAEV